MTLAAKVYALYFPTVPADVDSLDSQLQQVHLLYTYAMSLARYDTSYDIRDRARLLRNAHLTALREATFHTSKPVPRIETFGEQAREWRLGSMAQVIMRDFQGQINLPEWGSEIPEKGVRDVTEPSQTATVVTAGTSAASVATREEKRQQKKIWKDLDKFYASESEGEEEDEDDDDDDDDEEGEDDDETEEEEGESEDQLVEKEVDEQETEQDSGEDSEDDRLGQHTSRTWA
jgi:AP-3 complex subunit beta